MPSFLGEGCVEEIVSSDSSIVAVGEHFADILISGNEFVLFDAAVVAKIPATLPVAKWKNSACFVAEVIEDSKQFATICFEA